MKKIITIILLLPIMCWGQKKGYQIKGKVKDSTSAVLKMQGLGSTSTASDIIGSTLSLWATPSNCQNNFTITPRQDTVRCLMLVCDTRLDNELRLDTRGTEYVKENSVWWQFGYVVYGNIFYQPEYLNQNKKPLPKSIIVWISKQLNK